MAAVSVCIGVGPRFGPHSGRRTTAVNRPTKKPAILTAGATVASP